MKIIFCVSYLSVPITISIIEQEKGDFIIVTYSDNLEKFFSEIYGKEKIFKIKKLSFYLSLKLPVNLLKVIYYRKKYLKTLPNINNANIYFFFVAFAFFEASLIKKMSKGNNIYYKKSVNIEHYIKKKTFLSSLNTLFIKLLYDINIQAVYFEEKTLYTISQKFLNHLNLKEISCEIDYISIAKIISKRLSLIQNDILMLVGSVVESNFVNKIEYIDKNDILIEQLDKKRVIIKKHPHFNNLFSKEKSLMELPNYIPANLILNNFRIVIGYTTSTLFEAANSDIIAISLLNYFDPVSEIVKQTSINYLNKNLIKGKNIYFPNNLEELISIIKQ